MTRLVEADIDSIEKELKEYDRLFQSQTGSTLEEIACQAAGIQGKVRKRKTAAISVTSGMGIIGGFAQTEAAILRHCGIETFVPEKPDVGGIWEAYEDSCELAFLADDDSYVAVGIGNTARSENGEATGRGYGAALAAAIRKQGKSLIGSEVLILGAGPVGGAAARYLAEAGAIPVICDLNEEKSRRLAEQITQAQAVPSEAEIGEYKFIVDATTAANLIDEKNVSEDTLIAAPGMPCGVTEKAMEKAIVIHNPLELGTLTMYFECISQLEE